MSEAALQRCPKCGSVIKEGQLLCEACGAEINIVPEYETQIEASINETMNRIMDTIDREEKKESAAQKAREETEKKRRKLQLVLLGALCGVALAGVLFGTALLRWRRSEGYYVAKAYSLAEKGSYPEAAQMLNRALLLQDPKDLSLILLRGEYQLRYNDYAGVKNAVDAVLSSRQRTERDVMEAYSLQVMSSAAENDFQAIADMMRECPYENVRSSFADYLAEEPVFLSPAGKYEERVHLALETAGNAEICYRITREGEEPGEEQVYNAPIVLTDGIYTVSAYARNRFGITSGSVSSVYEVHPTRPEEPVILTPSGEYRTQMQILAEIPADGDLYYTTDGTDPTPESRKFTGDIPMPAGTSNYRFAVINDAGVSSEIVEMHYNRFYSPAIRAEDGPNYVLIALIRSGEVVDTVGTIRDGSARYQYRYRELTEIGTGSFYIYEELLTDMAGNAVMTGRVFAVNAGSGETFLCDGGSGNMQLIPIDG